MYEDFEEEYEEEDDEDTLIEKVQRGKNKYDDAKSKYDKVKEFDKSLRDKNIARGNNPELASNAATTGSTTTGATAGTSTVVTGGATGATTGATTAAGATAATGTAAASGTAATAGTAAAAGGAVAAQAAIPVAGWIALAVEAAIALLVMAVKLRKKHDKKMAENGVDSKSLRRLLKISPFLIPAGIILLILIILVQAETYDKAEFLKEAVKCMETDGGCNDFLNTGVTISGDGDPVIKKTDLELAGFVVKYMIAEHKCFGNDGSSIMDIMNDIDTIAREGLDDYNNKTAVERLFEELVEDGIIGDVRFAWNLFKWLKVEKKIYNNIQWYKAYNAANIGGVSAVEAWVQTHFDDEPSVIMGDTKFTVPWTFGFHDLGTAYLKTPVAIDVDDAIDLVRAYIPSWLEIYATYVATGDYELCNDIYNYYTNPVTYQLKVTLYQLLTVQEIEKEVENASIVEEVITWISEHLGFNVSVNYDYVGVVTQGNAYQYMVEKDYQISTEYTEESETITEEEKITHLTTKTWTNTIEYVADNITEYEENNRYEHIFVDMVKLHDYNFTIDDVAMAIEVINSYYEEEYNLSGNSNSNYQALPDGGFGWPVQLSASNPESASVLRFYGSITPNVSLNNGIDICSGNVNFTDPDNPEIRKGEIVVATHDGIVNKVQPVTDRSQMAYIEIRTEEGDYVTKYCNLSEIYVVEQQVVSKNDQIGRIGNTGAYDSDTELYLHYEVYYKGQATDPLTYYNITCNGAEVENYDELDKSSITNPKEYKYESSKTYLGGSGEVVEFARQYLGYSLSQMNNVRGTRFSDHWCAWFASWCLRECGIDIIECSNTNYCPTIWNETTGIKHPYNGEPYTPKPGDIIMFYSPSSGRYSHIAIVSKVEDGVVYWIGGNQGGNCPHGSKVTENRYDDRLKSYIEVN